MQTIQALMALNGLATTILIIGLAKYIKDIAKGLTEIKAVVEKNKEREEVFKEEVKETITKGFWTISLDKMIFWRKMR